MTLRTGLLLTLASLLAASGQMFLKAGATGNASLVDYLNWNIAIGLGLYCIGTVVWIYGLSIAPLTVVYSFVALTFAFIYLGSVFFLGERPNPGTIAGCLTVLVGLFLLFRYGNSG